MPETLLSPSNIMLFGRVVEDLEIRHGGSEHNPFVIPRESASSFLAKELSHARGEGKERELLGRFARIYGFSYEGRYYELPMPTLFLVHGDGADPERVAVDARAARAPDDSSRSGMAAQDFSFADNVRVWSYDRADLSIRLDVDSGTFEQILLDLVLGGGGGGPVVSGARVSGARVAGARVSGARVSGARVAGARVRGGRDGDSSD